MQDPKLAITQKVEAGNVPAQIRGTSNSLARELGENLKRIRQEKGFTQQNLAFAAEMDRTFVSLCERGGTNPSLFSLGTLCWCLDITLAELFEGVNSTVPPSGVLGGKKRRANQASHEPRPPSAATLKRAETMKRKKLELEQTAKQAKTRKK